MVLSPVFLKQFKNTVEQILHVPGNYNREKILEMTVVADCGLEQEVLKDLLPQLLRTLKMQSRVFQNVRFHFVQWKSDEEIQDCVCPMMSGMLESFYEEYECVQRGKRLEILAGYLKKFHARSKLIILLSDGGYKIEDEKLLKEESEPFLGKKLMTVFDRGEEIFLEYRGTKAG